MNQPAVFSKDQEIVTALNSLIAAVRRTDGLEPKTKHLVFIGIKTLIGDITSTNYHVKLAKKYGASTEEIIDTILLSSFGSNSDGKRHSHPPVPDKINISGLLNKELKKRFMGKNFGRITENKLLQAGIDSMQVLESIGVEQAFIRISALDKSQDLRLLFKLECAIHNIKLNELSNRRKSELKDFCKRIRNNNYNTNSYST